MADVRRSTHQADQEEEDLEAATKSGNAGDVTVTHSGHGDHEEVDAVPVGESLDSVFLVGVGEIWWVSAVFQLKCKLCDD